MMVYTIRRTDNKKYLPLLTVTTKKKGKEGPQRPFYLCKNRVAEIVDGLHIGGKG